MSTVSLENKENIQNIDNSLNIMLKHSLIEEKLNDLEDKIDNLIKSEDFSPKNKRNLNIKRYIDNYHYDKKMKEKEVQDRIIFNSLMEKVEDSKEKEKYIELMRKKPLLNKSVKLEEIKSHEAKFKEMKSRITAIREIEKQRKFTEIKNVNNNLSTSIEYTKKQLQQFEKNQKSLQEKEKLDYIFRNLNKKEFSKMVNDVFKPEVKKTHREPIIRIKPEEGEKFPVHKRKHKSILLKKSENKKKYNWELKLDKSNDFDYSQQSSSSSLRKEKKYYSPPEIRTPMLRRPDYLKEARILKENRNNSENSFSLKNSDRKWERMLNDKKNIYSEDNSMMYNIENVKIKANYLESKAKRAEVLIKNSNLKSNPEASRQVSELYVDSIKAKLAILNKINKIN